MMSLDVPNTDFFIIEQARIKLTVSDRLYAQKFCQQQSDLAKAKQVYKNTLAVAAVNTYLQLLGWNTSLKRCDSWDFLMQTLLDTADLEISDRGKIECRPVESSQGVMIIPEEVAKDRVAYIAVEIEESANFARLLGFVSTIESTAIPLNSLQAIAELPQYLENYNCNLIIDSAMKNKQQVLPKLSNWLLGVVEAGWQTIDDLLATHPYLEFLNEQNRFSFRSLSQTSVKNDVYRETLATGTSRIKLWNLGRSPDNTNIALIITLSSTEGDELELSLKVCPTNEDDYLPPGLLIQILDEAEQSVLQALTKSTNEAIEFFLSGETGEFFSIQATFKDETITESFMI